MVLEKTPESPLDSKETNPVNLQGNKLWIVVERTVAEVETPIFWSSDANSWLTGKVPDAGKDWGQKEKRTSEDEMAEQPHRCNKQEVGQTPADGEGQGGLEGCSPWSRKELDTTERLNELNWTEAGSNDSHTQTAWQLCNGWGKVELSSNSHPHYTEFSQNNEKLLGRFKYERS